MNKLILCLAIFCTSLTACGTSDKCVVGTTRCAEETVQLCNANSEWTVTDDCRVVAGLNGGQWVCSEADVEAGLPAACLPIDNVEVVTDTE